MDKLDPEYLLGVVDSLGHFTVFTYKSYRYPKFVVYTRDRYIAALLYSFFNVGKIVERTRCGKKPIYVYSVSRYDELKQIVDFFDKHRLRIKYHEFAKFRAFFSSWRPKVQRRSREENVKALQEALRMYREGLPVKEIVSKTGVSLSRLYMILKAYNLRRYNKVEDVKRVIYPFAKK